MSARDMYCRPFARAEALYSRRAMQNEIALNESETRARADAWRIQ
jgi:hypothetical protein